VPADSSFGSCGGFFLFLIPPDLGSFFLLHEHPHAFFHDSLREFPSVVLEGSHSWIYPLYVPHFFSLLFFPLTLLDSSLSETSLFFFKLCPSINLSPVRSRITLSFPDATRFFQALIPATLPHLWPFVLPQATAAADPPSFGKFPPHSSTRHVRCSTFSSAFFFSPGPSLFPS